MHTDSYPTSRPMDTWKPNRIQQQIASQSGWADQSTKFETLQIHAGTAPDPTTRARAMPIYYTASFAFENSEAGAKIFNMEEWGFTYSRIMNPTVFAFEKRMAKLEGGKQCIACASGQAALFLTVTNLCTTGQHVAASPFLYGGSFQQFKVTLPRLGISTTFAKSLAAEDMEAAIQDNTRMVYIESLANPKYCLPDFQAISEVAHKHGLPLVCDNTFGAGGYFIRPFEHGVDIVTHSATKWIGGHGTTLGGLVIDGGKFNWKLTNKFPQFTEPAEGYHGMNLADRFGPTCFGIRLRVDCLRDIGASLNPFAAHQLAIGAETLSLRCERHAYNSMRLAEWLEACDYVSWVVYPGLKSHPDHDLAQKYMPRGFGSALCFGVHGGGDAGKQVVDNFQLISNCANVGDAKTLANHPWSTVQDQLPPADKLKSGVSEDMIRLSVGIEHVDDLILDFQQSFARSSKALAKGASHASARGVKVDPTRGGVDAPLDAPLEVSKETMIREEQRDLSAKLRVTNDMGPYNP